MLTILLALTINLFLGFFVTFFKAQATPVLWTPFIKIALWCEKKLKRDGRSRQDLILRGFLAYSAALFVAIILFFIFEALLYAARQPEAALILSATVLALSISSSAIIGLIWTLSTGLKKGADQSKGIFKALARSTHVNISTLDHSGLIRLSITFITILTSRAYVAPIFWFYCFGGAGVLFYSATQATSFVLSRYGHHNGFATIPSIISRILNFLPEIVSGAVMVLCSAFVPSMKMRSALKSLSQLKKAPPYEQGGVPLHILAYATDMGLGGPMQSDTGVILKNNWAGPSGATANVNHTKIKVFSFLLVIYFLITKFLVIMLFVQP